MSTIHDLRAWQSGAVQSRISDADGIGAEQGATKRGSAKQGSAEIILFPKASLKALQRPRKKQLRRRALRA